MPTLHTAGALSYSRRLGISAFPMQGHFDVDHRDSSMLNE
jgi:hypothetical protein